MCIYILDIIVHLPNSSRAHALIAESTALYICMLLLYACDCVCTCTLYVYTAYLVLCDEAGCVWGIVLSNEWDNHHACLF